MDDLDDTKFFHQLIISIIKSVILWAFVKLLKSLSDLGRGHLY